MQSMVDLAKLHGRHGHYYFITPPHSTHNNAKKQATPKCRLSVCFLADRFEQREQRYKAREIDPQTETEFHCEPPSRLAQVLVSIPCVTAVPSHSLDHTKGGCSSHKS